MNNSSLSYSGVSWKNGFWVCLIMPTATSSQTKLQCFSPRQPLYFCAQKCFLHTYIVTKLKGAHFLMKFTSLWFLQEWLVRPHFKFDLIVPATWWPCLQYFSHHCFFPSVEVKNIFSMMKIVWKPWPFQVYPRFWRLCPT